MNRRTFLKGFIFTAAVASYELSPIKFIEASIADSKFVTFDQIIATTLQNYRKVIAKNITSNQVIWMKLKENNLEFS